MNISRRVCAIVAFLAFMTAGQSLADINGRTGATVSGCVCHGGTSSSTVSVVIAGPATLAPGTVGSYTITVAKSGTTYAGVDIAVNNSATLSTTDAALKVSGGEITHKAALTPGTAYNFKVTAPLSGGSFTISAVGVAASTNSSPTGNWNVASAANVALPIQLSSFTGSMASGGGVQLQWKTASEINNYGFYVQRGPSMGGPFADMPGAFVAGHGTTADPHTYEYSDASVVPGTTPYYRLRQVNLDGTQSFSDPIGVAGVSSVVVDVRPLIFEIQSNYPNPFNPSTMIGYQLPAAGNVKLVVYDVAGREVAVLASGMMEAGRHEALFNAAGLASGIYLCRLEAGGMVAVRKMVLMK